MGTEQDFWRECWQGHRTGWDLGGAHECLVPLLKLFAKVSLIESLGAPGPLRIYSPGCGRAHDGAAIVSRSIPLPPSLAARQIEVMATDFAPEAIDAAREIYGNLTGKGLSLAVEDARADVPVAEKQKFHVVFDRAMLCALRPDLRPAYLRACHDRLAPGGIFLSLPFTRIEDTPEHPPGSGPPFEITMANLETLMADHHFRLLAAEKVVVRRPDTIIKEEALTVFEAIKKRKKILTG